VVESDGALMLGPPGSEQYRTRVAFVFLIGGLALLFWAWGSWVFRASSPAMAGRIPTAPQMIDGVRETEMSTAERSRVVRGGVAQFLLFGLALVMLVIFGTYTAVRASRRYRAASEAKQKKPLDRLDAWSMYKLPAEDDADEGG